jgi:sulfotransferase family protein
MPTLKNRAPHRFKVLGRRVSLAAGVRTSALRMTPSFVLAGGQRCGTTSLFRALLEHPAILGPVHHKGINYFDINYDRGWDWYQGHFPLRSMASLRTRRADEEAVTFDASGYYMYHPNAADRLVADLPGVKVMVMLRDPVERAFSAYKHEFARGFETETFERALALEDERVEPELARMASDPGYASYAHRHQSYRRRGYYAEQVERFTRTLGPDRVLVVDSERFFSQPLDEYSRIIDFLGLKPHQPARFDQWNARPGTPMREETRRELTVAFEPHDLALQLLIGHPPSWRR